MSIFAHIVQAIFGKSEETAFPISRTELEKQIAALAVNTPQRHNWRTSIVDLLKLLNVPNDLDAREELARELGYTGAIDGSDRMNTWLHEAVMKKLCETGGKVPDSFRD
jgi:hypothetical protein